MIACEFDHPCGMVILYRTHLVLKNDLENSAPDGKWIRIVYS